MTPGLGTTFDDVELLGLADFAYTWQGEMTIEPTSSTQLGNYPFVVRVKDNQGRPQDAQYSITVAAPNIAPESVAEDYVIVEEGSGESAGQGLE